MARFVGTPLRGTEFSTVSDEAISARVNGDGHPRIRIDAGGRITWSSGAAAGDTNLYRDEANVLTTDDLFKATGGLVTVTTDGEPTSSLPDGALAIDTTNNVFYFRSDSAWNQVSGGGGASVTVSDTAPVGAENGDLWFNSATALTYVYYDSTWVQVGGGTAGPSAYEVAVANGFVGTESEWLDSLVGPTGSIDELSDVVITSATTGQVLKYDGTNWINDTDNAGTTIDSIDDINDVTITSVASGDFLQWNGTAWVNESSPTYVQLDTSVGSPASTEGKLQWDSDFGTLSFGLEGNNSVQQIGINQFAYCYNAEATTLNKGEVVYIFGGQGSQVSIKRALNTSDATSARTLGLVSESITAGGSGYVCTYGVLAGIDTSGYTVGQILYLGASAGQLTTTKPAAPNHYVFVAVVIKAGDGGELWIRPQNGYELDEIHDVSIVDKTSGDFLKYNGTLWVNDQINLGTDTVGNYVSDVTAGTGVTVTHTPSEGSSPTIAIGQAVASTDSPTFASVTGGNIVVGSDKITTASSVNNLRIEPISKSGNKVQGDALNILGSSVTGTGGISGGSITIDAGSASPSSGDGDGGEVSINAGYGTTQNGRVSIGTSNTREVLIGNISTTTSVTVGSNLVVGGDLTVNGTTTTLNTETLAVEDNIVVLNSGVTGSPTLDAGIEVERGTSTNVSIKWNETTDKWQFTDDGTTYVDLEASRSAYTIAVDNGFVGTESEWLDSLVGPEGPQGVSGVDGMNGLGYGFEPYDGMLTPDTILFDELTIGTNISMIGTVGAYKVGDKVRITGSYNGFPVDGAYLVGTIFELFGVGTNEESAFVNIEKWVTKGSVGLVPEKMSLIGLDGLGYGFERYPSMMEPVSKEFANLTVGSIIEVSGTVGAYKIGDRVKVTGSDGNNPAVGAYIIGTITSFELTEISGEGVVVVVEKRYANGYEYFVPQKLSIVGTDGLGYGFEFISGSSSPSPILVSYLSVGYVFETYGTIGAYKIGDRVRVTDPASPGLYIIGRITDFTSSPIGVEVTVERWYDPSGGFGIIEPVKMSLVGEDGADGQSFIYLGDWSASTTYNIGDVVKYNYAIGSGPPIPSEIYISITDSNTGNEPWDYPSDWSLMVKDGEQGPTGPTGPAGGGTLSEFLFMGA